MNKFLLFLSLLPFLVNAQNNKDEKVVHPDSVQFNNGYITYQGKDFTGVLQADYPDGDRQAVARVLLGKYHGVLRTYYPNGQTHMVLQYSEGELVKAVSVYYRNGEPKLRAEVMSQEREGGDKLKNINYGRYRQTELEIKFKGTARFQVITNEGLSAYKNGYIPCHKIAGFRLFDKSLKNNGRFIIDSREMLAP